MTSLINMNTATLPLKHPVSKRTAYCYSFSLDKKTWRKYHSLVTGPPNGPVLFCSLTSVVCRRRLSSVKPGPHQQQCRSNIRLCCQKRQQCRTSFALKFRPFDNVERCFDIVASVDRALGRHFVLDHLISVFVAPRRQWQSYSALGFRNRRSLERFSVSRSTTTS